MYNRTTIFIKFLQKKKKSNQIRILQEVANPPGCQEAQLTDFTVVTYFRDATGRERTACL